MERRFAFPADRRSAPRGGRRASDRPGRCPTILVVDSYEDARSPIARYLDRYGFDVLEATGPHDAADLIDRRGPRAVLSGLHGTGAAHLYSKLSATAAAVPTVLIVMQSASDDDPLPYPPTAVLSKPFSLRTMLDELRRGLGVSSADPALDGS